MKIDMYSKLQLLLAKESQTSVLNIKDEMMELEKWAYKDPGLYRTIRHDIQSGQYNYIDTYKEHPLYKYARKYGRRSITFGTYCKIVSMVRIKPDKLSKVVGKSKPPAFDKKWRAVCDDALSYDDIIRLAAPLMYRMRTYLSQEIGKLKQRIILLNNGSSMGYQVGNVDVTDTMANICSYPNQPTFEHLGKYLKVINSRTEDDPFVYLSHDQYDGYSFNHLYVPDKDGKVREVYQGNSDVQIIAKAFHEVMHNVAIRLPGNYTTSHRAWIYNLLRKGWHKTKLIITTDMSKYSDTLDRAFIMKILEHIGIPEDVLQDIDKLYSCAVYDKETGKIYSESLATLQGEYGDFPLITIANIVIQYAIYAYLDQELKEGYNAAVGDDTGFIFEPNVDPDIAFAVIKRFYNSVGVNINKLKTGRLIKGRGSCDFVKIHFDGEGILPHLEVRSYKLNNQDQVIRDIFDNPGFDADTKKNYFRIIFGKPISEYLMSIHKINGGLRTDRITVSDVQQFIANSWSIINEIDINHGQLVTFLEHARRELNENGYGLRDTCLCRFRTEKSDNPEEEDDNIIVNLLAISRLGFQEDIDYLLLVGRTWDQIADAEKHRLKGESYDPYDLEAYKIVANYFNILGKYKDRLKNRGGNVYLKHYEEYMSNEYEHKMVMSLVDLPGFQLDSLADYQDNIQNIINDINFAAAHVYTSYYDTINSPIVKIAKYYYVIHDGIKYRLYDTKGKSKYDIITPQIMGLYPKYFRHYKSIAEVLRAYQFES